MANEVQKLNSSTSLTTKRPPVVVVMGHVDHGKTTLLDYIRKSNVAAREAGGITQGVGAYEITYTPMNANINADERRDNQRKSASSDQRESAVSRKITFIDTPGHAAFSKMRERGAKIADLAILVVAADDGFQVQSREALAAIRQAKLPFIVAINKIDKNNANIEKTKTELLQNQVLLEGLGGDTSFQLLSAKTGEGVNELLDLILLTADVEDWTYDPNAPASGFVLEAKSDHRTGAMVTVIIKNGTLRLGEEISAGLPASGGQVNGKVKDLKNFLGEKVEALTASSPALILGFESLPKIGEPFLAGAQEKKVAKAAVKKPVAVTDKRNLNVIIKANVSGALEALAEAIKKLTPPNDSRIIIFDEGVGEVTDGDAKLAGSTNAILVAFKVKVNAAARTVIKSQHVPLFESEIIYELLEEIEKYFKAQQKQIITGELEVLAVFDQKNLLKQIIGGKVVSGAIKNQATIEIQRKGKTVGAGKIVNLQQGRKDVQEVATGLECGLLVNAPATIAQGDRIIARSE